MASTGARLREERETRGVSLAQIAEATGVSPVYLEAMETGTFDRLPGRAFGKLYIRAYAEVLAFDPRPVLEMYDNERRSDRAAETTRPAPVGSRPVAEAIARWKAARSDLEPIEVEGETVVVEQEPVVEPVPAVVDAELETAPIEESMASEPAAEPIVEIPSEPVEPPGTPTVPPPAPLQPSIVRAPTIPSDRRWLVALVAALVVVVAIALLWGLREPTRPVPKEAVQEPVSTASPLPPSPPPPSPPAAAVTTPRREPRPAPKASGPKSDLSVSEYGLGRRVVSSRLQGESDRFTAGEVVTFQTRVLGGQRGDAIRHVWIHEGRAQQSIALRVNDGDWRTHSTKTIYKAGSWTVEARDTSGTVLAAASFTCVPK